MIIGIDRAKGEDFTRFWRPAKELIFCECCGEMKPWSTTYRGLQSRGRLMAVCPGCKEYLERKDKEATNGFEEVHATL